MCLCWISALEADTIGEQALEEITDSFRTTVCKTFTSYFALNFVVVTLRNA